MRILAINGSLQEHSSNRSVLAYAIAAHASETIMLFDRLKDIPPFESTAEETTPEAVAALRTAVAEADGVLISSPEYAHSMPGLLKNALDWLVGSGEFALKPVAIISVSTTPTAGLRAQIALIQTLLAHSAEIVALLPVGSSKALIGTDGTIADETLRRRIEETVRALVERCRVSHRAAL